MAVSGVAAAGRRIEQIRERLVASLKLTEAQQKKLDPILQDSRQQMQTVREALRG